LRRPCTRCSILTISALATPWLSAGTDDPSGIVGGRLDLHLLKANVIMCISGSCETVSSIAIPISSPSGAGGLVVILMLVAALLLLLANTGALGVMLQRARSKASMDAAPALGKHVLGMSIANQVLQTVSWILYLGVNMGYLVSNVDVLVSLLPVWL
jgi:hypothetical protein